MALEPVNAGEAGPSVPAHVVLTPGKVFRSSLRLLSRVEGGEGGEGGEGFCCTIRFRTTSESSESSKASASVGRLSSYLNSSFGYFF